MGKELAITKIRIEQIQKYESQIAKALPNTMGAMRFMRVMSTAINKNPKLAQCTPQTLFGSMMLAAQLGLEPNSPTQQCFLIPYENRRANTTECQFQFGFRGLLEIVRRSGQVGDIYAEIVYENDTFELSLGINREIKHIPLLNGDRGKPKLAYAVAEILNGDKVSKAFTWMSVEEIEKARMTSSNEKFSKGKGYDTPWSQWWDEMAKKTVLKRLCKTLPLSMDDMRRVEADFTVKANPHADDMLEDQDIEVQADVVDSEPETADAEELQQESKPDAKAEAAAEVLG